MLHTLTYGRNIGTQGYVTDLDWELYCQELLDAVGLEYDNVAEDDTQNEICISLDESGFHDVFNQSLLSMTNEQTIGTAMLNHELGEYVTKVTVYTLSGDKITFE